MIQDNLERLKRDGVLEKDIVLWGIGRQSIETYEWIRQNYESGKIIRVIDNFKNTFTKEWRGIPVSGVDGLDELEAGSYVVLLAVNYADAIRVQLEAYGIMQVYNLYDLEEQHSGKNTRPEYQFYDRSRGKKNLCYILAGYEEELWESTLERILCFQSEEFDYCIVSSGRYDENLKQLAKREGWSYLYSETNQVCVLQNIVIELHPLAEYIIKMDEDMFIGAGFFEDMLNSYHRIERTGEYRIGFMVPVIPLNCCGYVTYLDKISKTAQFEAQFGKAYRSRFSAVYDLVEAAEFLWDTMEDFDSMAEYFTKYRGRTEILGCYFNIGCIMFSRKRWLLMGKWPENAGSTGMGEDEVYIYKDNMEKDMPIYEAQDILVGHFAFGGQKQRMRQYYMSHRDKFIVKGYSKGQIRGCEEDYNGTKAG